MPFISNCLYAVPVWIIKWASALEAIRFKKQKEDCLHDGVL